MTTSKSTTEPVRVSEIRYRRLFEAAREGILILDAKTLKITDANPYMTELLGYSYGEFVGRELWQIGLFNDRQASKSAFKEVQKTGFLRYDDLPLETVSGTKKEVEFVSNVYDEDGTDVIHCSIRDITERVAAEKEIARLYEEMEMRVVERTRQLEAANKELEAFSYSVSHDLRAPLRHINGFSLALLEDYGHKLDETGKDYLTQVREASLEMAVLIENVLKLSRISREMIFEAVDVTHLAEVAIKGSREDDPNRKVSVDIERGLTVQGDKGLVGILITNLLRNSWKFTAKTTRAHIAFGHEIHDGEIVYFVRDNGAGFDMKYADKLFGVFQRLHSSTEFEGTGIGLATVQRVVNRHGGRVWAEAVVDKGATFYFTLPDPGDPKK